jgi:hypothetical protein
MKDEKVKYVLVPQSDIDRLEKARLELYTLLLNTKYKKGLPNGITEIMWKISHSNYQEV